MISPVRRPKVYGLLSAEKSSVTDHIGYYERALVTGMLYSSRSAVAFEARAVGLERWAGPICMLETTSIGIEF